MKNAKKVTAIILIAGNSSRFGKNTNKNFELINGKTVLSYSLDAFDKNSYVDNIIIATKENEKERVMSIIEQGNYSKKIDIVSGGNTRKESVYNCIKSTDADIIIIHDGARPAVKNEYIDKCIENINEVEGVTIGVKSKDTIKVTNQNNMVIGTTERENTWLIQTPQCFKREILLKMHEKYKKDDVTDDCMLLEKEGYKVKVIEGDYTNIKITTYEDYRLLKQLI